MHVIHSEDNMKIHFDTIVSFNIKKVLVFLAHDESDARTKKLDFVWTSLRLSIEFLKGKITPVILKKWEFESPILSIKVLVTVFGLSSF